MKTKSSSMSLLPSVRNILAVATATALLVLPSYTLAATLVAQWDLNGGSPATVISSQTPIGTDSADFSTASGLAWGGSASPASGSTNYLDFDGTNAGNTLDTNVIGTALAGTGAKTFVAWINPTAGNGGIVSYSPQGGNALGGELRFLLDGNGKLRGEVSGGYFVYTGIDFRNEGWNMVAVIFDGNTNTSKFYLGGTGMLTPDNVVARSIDTTATLGLSPKSNLDFVLGAIHTDSYGFSGGIDMVSVYDGALSLAELDALYGDGGGVAEPNGPVAEWDFNEGGSATVTTAQIPSDTDSADFSTANGLGWGGTAGAAPGSTDYLSFSGLNANNTLNTQVSGADLAGTGAKTFVAWINPTAGNGGIVSYSPEGGLVPGADLRFTLDGNGYLRGEVSGGYFVYTGKDFRNDGWNMVAAVFDGNTNTSKFYLGGAGELTPDNVGARDINTGGAIGAGINSEMNYVIGSIQVNGYGFTGGIDMVKVFDRALTPQELDSLYTTGSLSDAPPPLVFINTKVAAPGDLIILHGARFNIDSVLPEVWIDEIVDSNDVPNPETPINLVSVSDILIHAEIPSTMPEGLYAVFVKRGSSVSEPVWVNRSDAWQVLDLAGTEVDPDRNFRLSGWNLEMAGATSQVFFEDTATSVRTAATVTNSDRANIVELTSPSTLTVGRQYRLIVTNGYGGSYGETEGPLLDCIATPADPLGLDVPWAAEFDFADNNIYDVTNDPRLSLHAVGDGVTDDLAALQAACDAATADGGGAVYLPAGTYKLSAELKPQSRVVLRGDGMNETTIEGSIEPWLVHATLGTMQHNGAMDLTLSNGDMRWSGFVGPAIVVRVRIDTEGGEGLNLRGCTTKGLVKDSEIITRAVDGKTNFRAWWSENLLIKNTLFEWSQGRLEVLYSKNLQIDSCTMTRRTDTDHLAPFNYGAWDLSGSSELTVIDNLFNKLDNAGIGKIIDYGDGETIMNQCMSRFGWGYATSATENTLTDVTINDLPLSVPPREWYPNELVADYNHTLIGKNAIAMIVGGPGAGQSRKIIANTSDTVTLDEPWDIVPTTESAYAILRGDAHWLVASNVFEECPSTIWIFGSALSDVAVVDNDFVNSADIALRAGQYFKDTGDGLTYPAGMFYDPADPDKVYYWSHNRRFGGIRNALVQNNEMIADGSELSYPAQISCQSFVVLPEDPTGFPASIGNSFWDVMIRDNHIQSVRPNTTSGNSVGVNGEGYFAVSKMDDNRGDFVDGRNSVDGVVFDRNAGTNLDEAYHLTTGVMQTTIWKPVLNNVGTPVVDEVLSGATQGAIGTAYVP